MGKQCSYNINEVVSDHLAIYEDTQLVFTFPKSIIKTQE